MNLSIRELGLLTLAVVMSGCEIFENQSPTSLSFRMSGAPGDVVTVIYSKQFISATDEQGVTHLEVFRADTVVHTLPIDTIVDVRIERQMFLSARPLEANDTIPVSVRIEVNDRDLFDDSGSLLPDDPWLFLYRFNAPPTQMVEVVI